MTAELRVFEGDRQDKASLIGTTIDGRYEVERILGEGGMGLVYQARHIVLNKPLAIKVLRPDVSRDEEIITRFRQEAQSASAIGNQHIIDISDFGLLPDHSTYFVMEFLEGIDLTGAIERDEQMSAPDIIHIAKQLCFALGAAHEVGIVHRDLKPDNIYLIRRGGDNSFVKVLDFGIAKVGGNSSKLTRAGQVFGTPHYMSPEQCAGSGVDHRTDIYALGVILYEMSTGVCPFDADNLMGILTKHLYEEPVAPRERVPDIPQDLEEVILKAMSKKVETRYQTMAELLEDIQRLEAGVTTVARETTQSVSLELPERKNRGAILGGVFLVLAGIGAVVAYSMMGEEPTIVEVEPEIPEVVVPEIVPEIVPEVDGPVEIAGQNTEEPPEAVVVMVQITSEPVGAELWRGEDFIGNTPFSIERPSERVGFSLRLPQFLTREFQLSSQTGTSIQLNLERRRRAGMRPRGMRGDETMADMQTTTTPVMTEMSSTMMRGSSSEVLNPWGD